MVSHIHHVTVANTHTPSHDPPTTPSQDPPTTPSQDPPTTPTQDPPTTPTQSTFQFVGKSATNSACGYTHSTCAAALLLTYTGNATQMILGTLHHPTTLVQYNTFHDTM